MQGGRVMIDTTLERIWHARENISKKCDFDAHKLVKYYQKRSKDKVSEQNKCTVRCAAARDL
jgi:hypothetical protein